MIDPPVNNSFRGEIRYSLLINQKLSKHEENKKGLPGLTPFAVALGRNRKYHRAELGPLKVQQ